MKKEPQIARALRAAGMKGDRDIDAAATLLHMVARNASLGSVLMHQPYLLVDGVRAFQKAGAFKDQGHTLEQWVDWARIP